MWMGLRILFAFTLGQVWPKQLLGRVMSLTQCSSSMCHDIGSQPLYMCPF